MISPEHTVPLCRSKADDRELMVRFRGGEEQALILLLDRYSGRLGRFYYRMTGDPGGVDDFLQDVFFRVYRGRETWVPSAPLGVWLFTIARRLVFDRSRRRKRRPLESARSRMGPPGGTTSLVGKIPDHAPTPCSALSHMELALKVDEALEGIPIHFREAVVLCDIQHLSYSEAASILGCSTKTLSIRLSRGRSRLRTMLSPMLRAGDAS